MLNLVLPFAEVFVVLSYADAVTIVKPNAAISKIFFMCVKI
jgi:hypothetical protein